MHPESSFVKSYGAVELGTAKEKAMPKKTQTYQNTSSLVIPSAPIIITAMIDRPGHDGELPPEHLSVPTPIPLDEDRYGTSWQEFERSNASRRPSAKSATNFRVYGVDQYGREFFGESWGEFGGLEVLMADRNVERVDVQFTPVPFFDEDGVERHTTFDIMAYMRSGKQYAIAIKPEMSRETSGVDAMVAAVKRDNPDFADDVFVRTDADISETAIHNARLVLRSARICNAAHVDELAAIAAKTVGRLSIGALLELYRDDGVGFAAAILLVQQGALEPSEPERLTRRTMVRWTGGPRSPALVSPATDPSDATRALVITNHL